MAYKEIGKYDVPDKVRKTTFEQKEYTKDTLEYVFQLFLKDEWGLQVQVVEENNSLRAKLLTGIDVTPLVELKYLEKAFSNKKNLKSTPDGSWELFNNYSASDYIDMTSSDVAQRREIDYNWNECMSYYCGLGDEDPPIAWWNYLEREDCKNELLVEMNERIRGPAGYCHRSNAIPFEVDWILWSIDQKRIIHPQEPPVNILVDNLLPLSDWKNVEKWKHRIDEYDEEWLGTTSSNSSGCMVIFLLLSSSFFTILFLIL
jgi:hypothetical protein